MSLWGMGGLLTLALVAGFLAGWIVGKASGARPPNPYAATLLLLVGFLGGPVATFKLMGAGLWSYVVALVVAGLTAGVAFWPLGQRQGTREWL